MKLAAIALVGGFIIGAVLGYKYATGEAAKDKVDAIAKIHKEHKVKQDKVDETNQKQLNELQTINSNLVSDINRLQHRASRRTTESKQACKSATGANLSREDATFLTGEAARADTLRAALIACYEYADEVSK